MNARKLVIACLGVLAVGAGLPAPARAGIQLSFDQANYSIPSVGGTVDVKVFVQQTTPPAMGEPTVDAMNGLTAASIKLTVNSPTIANVLTDPAGGPAWLASSGGFDGSGNPNLAVVSIPGLDITGSPVLLGTFTFTGLSPGSTLTISSLLDPSSGNFTDSNGDVLDPFVVGSSATITVGGVAAVPEPATIVPGLMAAVAMFALKRRVAKRGDRGTR